MFDRRLYREEAVANKWRGEKLDELLRVSAPHEWAVVAALALVLLGIVAWVLFGSVERIVSADCLLVRPGERRAIVAGVSGSVVDVLVKPGATLEPGQAIARLHLPLVHREVRVARARVGSLEAQLAESGSSRTKERLRAAREELRVLEAVAESAGVIVSPRRGRGDDTRSRPGSTGERGNEGLGDSKRRRPSAAGGRFRRRGERAGHRDRTGGANPYRAGSGSRRFSIPDAGISEISPRPLPAPDWLTVPGLETAGRGHLVRLDFEVPPAAPEVAEGQRCTLHVVTRRHPPISLMLPAGNG